MFTLIHVCIHKNPVCLNFILLLITSCPLTSIPSGTEMCFTNGTKTTEYCWYNDAQAAQVGIVCVIIGRVNHGHNEITSYVYDIFFNMLCLYTL